MPDDIRLRDEDDELDDAEEGDGERGIAESDDEFDDDEELDEEEDEELQPPEGIADDRSFTSEIGSEGGSHGDIERELPGPPVQRGSESTTTAQVEDRKRFVDRKAGGGVGRPRE